MRLELLSLLAALAPSFVFADVQFTSPAAGASIPAGAITVKWVDSGIAPTLAQLSSYTITLMVGGQTDATALQLTTIGTSPGSFAKGDTATGTIDPGLASSLTNGFYLKIISTAKTGGTVINYSDRFTITGMTGTTSATIQKAVVALGGTTAGPPTENDVVVGGAQPAPPAVTTPAVGNSIYNVPYGQQTGLTKYAPMQGVPPTKITNKNMTPQNPTSAFNIAVTFLPKASIVTTLTESMTFSVNSHANTQPPQSKPTGDMQKFLARWKD